MKSDSIAYPPRGLRREEAARYIGVGPRKFDEMVADRRMPKAKRIDGIRVWDRAQVDVYFTALPSDDDKVANIIDHVLAGGSSKGKTDHGI
jgi:predicted DNA-binding transcriptional regulator AlpA